MFLNKAKKNPTIFTVDSSRNQQIQRVALVIRKLKENSKKDTLYPGEKKDKSVIS